MGLLDQRCFVNSHSQHLPKKAAAWSIALVMGVVAIYWASKAVAIEPASHDAEIDLVRRLAASDAAQLVELLDQSTVHISAGEFLMGSNTGRDDERPPHAVYLDTFEMDRYEITNAQYRRYLQATGRTPPPYWNGNFYPTGQADYPVVGVSWDDADAYCAWAGKRLPTEAEWEKACRGTDARVYPWGNTWEPWRANVDASAPAERPTGEAVWEVAWKLVQVTPSSYRPGLRPVGSYHEGASPYGVMDMIGNASEWVADWYNWGDYSRAATRNPINTTPPWNHVVRGTAWHDPTGDTTWVQTMSRCSARNSSHETRDPRTGFRCARS